MSREVNPADQTDRYIELVKKVISNHHAPGIGPRIRYLIDCADPNAIRPTRLVATPTDETGMPCWDIEYFRNIERYETEAIVGVSADPGGYYWWESTLGFPLTMVSPERVDNVEFAVRTAVSEGVPGDFLETGVWRGGLCVLAKALFVHLGESDRTVWLADSFEGLQPPSHELDIPSPLDGNWMLPTSADEVRANFASLDLLDEKVRFVEGWFVDTMPTLDTGPLSVLRLDGDYYSSTIEVLEPMYDHVSPGGFVIIDDYGFYEGCRHAVHDFLDSRSLTPDIIPIDDSGVYWRK